MSMADKAYKRTDAQNQALHMVLLQYTTIEGYGAEKWLDWATNGERGCSVPAWHQPVICTVDDIQDAMQYMVENYWTHQKVVA